MCLPVSHHFCQFFQLGVFRAKVVEKRGNDKKTRLFLNFYRPFRRFVRTFAENSAKTLHTIPWAVNSK